MKKYFFVFVLLFVTGLNYAENTVSIFSDTHFERPFLIPATTTVINGTNVPLMIDLGASMGDADIILKKAIAKKLGIIGHAPKICAYSQSGVTCYLTADINSIKIGEKTFSPIKALIALKDWGGGGAYHNLHKGKSYKNGVITFSFLSKYNILFDFPHNEMKLVDKEESLSIINLQTWTRIPFVLQNGVTTPLTINSKNMNIVWDTALMPSMLDQNKISGSYPCGADYQIFGKNLLCYTLNQTNFSLKFLVWDIKLPPQAMIDGVVGSDVFYQHQILMDFDNKIIYYNS